MRAVAFVQRAQGIKGELKVLPLTDYPEQLVCLKCLVADGVEYSVSSAYVHQSSVVLKLEGVDTREAADLFRDKYLYNPKKRSPGRDRFFIEDLLECQVFAGEELIGTLVSVDNYGSADVFTVKGGRVCRFPFLKKLNAEVDTEGKVIRVDKSAFDEVCVYED